VPAPGIAPETPYLLGDQHYNDPALHSACAAADQTIIATRKGTYLHCDSGAPVRKVFHQLRSHAIENFNQQFKGIFDVHRQVLTKGLASTRHFALGAIFVYQLCLWHRLEFGLDLLYVSMPFSKPPDY
jgi:hypothetical protein